MCQIQPVLSLRAIITEVVIHAVLELMEEKKFHFVNTTRTRL